MSDGAPSRAAFACGGRINVTVGASGIGRVAAEGFASAQAAVGDRARRIPGFAGAGQATNVDHHVEYL